MAIFAFCYRLLLGSTATLLLTFSAPAMAWDPWEDVFGEPINETFGSLANDLENLPGSWTRCAGNIDDCVEKQLGRAVYYAVWPIVESYRSHLQNQASGNSYSIPLELVSLLQPFYPGVDLRSVSLSTNVDTLHGNHITIENHIYFVDHPDIQYSEQGLELLAHELEHVVQYQNKGGYKNLISEYILHSAGKIIERGNFDIHDYISVERAAIEKASQVVESLKQRGLISGGQVFAGEPGDSFVPALDEEVFIPFEESNACYAQYGWCHIPVTLPSGSPCYCVAPNGYVDYGVIE